ncbi:MAG: hypothetical protein ACKVJU_16125 [Verrucomicrobiales bacterium]
MRTTQSPIYFQVRAIRRLFRMRSPAKIAPAGSEKSLAAPPHPGNLIHVGEKRSENTTFIVGE